MFEPSSTGLGPSTEAVGATYKSNQGRQPTTGTFRDGAGTSFAACFDGTTAFDQIACFSNSNARVDMVAPGAIIVSDYVGGGTSEFRGTSQASPKSRSNATR